MFSWQSNIHFQVKQRVKRAAHLPNPLLTPQHNNAQTLSRPCLPGDTLDVTLDASLSYDPSGRPLKSIVWSIASGSDATLLDLLEAANNKTGAG